MTIPTATTSSGTHPLCRDCGHPVPPDGVSLLDDEDRDMEGKNRPSCLAYDTACVAHKEKPAPRDVTPENLPDLVIDLKKAHGVALAAHATIDDLTGSCNMDSPVLVVKNIRLATAAVKIAGGDCHEWKRGKRSLGLVVNFREFGQAAKRTAFAEAFAKELEARGWAASVFYMVD